MSFHLYMYILLCTIVYMYPCVGTIFVSIGLYLLVYASSHLLLYIMLHHSYLARVGSYLYVLNLYYYLLAPILYLRGFLIWVVFMSIWTILSLTVPPHCPTLQTILPDFSRNSYIFYSSFLTFLNENQGHYSWYQSSSSSVLGFIPYVLVYHKYIPLRIP